MNESALQILQKLVEIPSVSGDHVQCKRALDYIDSFLRKRGMYVQRHTFNGFGSLVATTKPTKTPTVLLNGHIDVVPAPQELYSITRKDGKLIGRGVFDMKASIAAYLQVVDDLQNHLHEYDFGIMIVSDEEIGGYDGAVPLIEEGYLPKVCVIPDGGQDWALETFAKGLWLIDITVEGKSAHASRPWEGESAIDKLVRITHEIKSLVPAEQGWNTSTCTIAQIDGGEAINQVPATARASLDIRFASIEDEKNITNAIKLICKASGANIVHEIYSAPCINDPENPYLRSFTESIEKTIGYSAGTTISNAGTDGRFFAAKGVPCAIFYPTGGGHHGPHEWIPEEAFGQMQAIFRDYLEKEARASTVSTSQRTEQHTDAVGRH